MQLGIEHLRVCDAKREATDRGGYSERVDPAARAGQCCGRQGPRRVVPRRVGERVDVEGMQCGWEEGRFQTNGDAAGGRADSERMDATEWAADGGTQDQAEGGRRRFCDRHQGAWRCRALARAFFCMLSILLVVGRMRMAWIDALLFFSRLMLICFARLQGSRCGYQGSVALSHAFPTFPPLLLHASCLMRKFRVAYAAIPLVDAHAGL